MVLSKKAPLNAHRIRFQLSKFASNHVSPASPFLPQFHDKWNGTDDSLRPRFGSPKQRNILPLFLSADNNAPHCWRCGESGSTVINENWATFPACPVLKMRFHWHLHRTNRVITSSHSLWRLITMRMYRTSCNRNGAAIPGRYRVRRREVATSRASHWNTHEFRSRLRCPPVFPSTFTYSTWNKTTVVCLQRHFTSLLINHHTWWCGHSSSVSTILHSK